MPLSYPIYPEPFLLRLPRNNRHIFLVMRLNFHGPTPPSSSLNKIVISPDILVLTGRKQGLFVRVEKYGFSAPWKVSLLSCWEFEGWEGRLLTHLLTHAMRGLCSILLDFSDNTPSRIMSIIFSFVFNLLLFSQALRNR